MRGLATETRGLRGRVRLAAVAAGLLACSGAFAHPEFQRFLAENAPRHTDCAMCHRHPDGPEGPKPGQIGSLAPEEIELLQRARSAFEPGHHVENPLLNEFGNDILTRIGKRELLRLRKDPAALAAALGSEGDLDDEGASVADEYLAGTHPVDPQSGPPAALFLHNLRRYRMHVALIVLATIAGLYGLNNLLRWFDLTTREDKGEDSVSHLFRPTHPHR